jgi:hypothetical protein
VIHIATRRAGLIVLAATVNDLGDVTQAWGLTTWAAEKRLIRRLNRVVSERPAECGGPK